MKLELCRKSRIAVNTSTKEIFLLIKNFLKKNGKTFPTEKEWEQYRERFCICIDSGYGYISWLKENKWNVISAEEFMLNNGLLSNYEIY